ncbi:MAG: hypothetical protein ACOVS5_04950, partial [Oligoflexus sp.]
MVNLTSEATRAVLDGLSGNELSYFTQSVQVSVSSGEGSQVTISLGSWGSGSASLERTGSSDSSLPFDLFL